VKPWVEDIRQHIEIWSARLGSLSWWPRYVYHFTDIHNAVEILKSRHLYCRSEATRRGLMAIDNASQVVIQQTQPEYLDYVRFYFRPRTPTQYRNEGIRPVNQRDLGAHCPIPVFLCFDALTILSLDETKFSNGNLASHRVSHSSERSFFLNIPFDQVFHEGRIPPEKREEIVFHRNAEVLVPQQLALEPGLKFIACRSLAERQTLLHMLPVGLASRWAKYIRLGEVGLFFREWTFVETVTIVDNKVSFRFNPNTRTPGPFDVRLSYQEESSGVTKTWAETVEKLDRSLKFRFEQTQHRWGTATLHLDDSLAFAGLLLFEE
jgi:hypothetical protein